MNFVGINTTTRYEGSIVSWRHIKGADYIDCVPNMAYRRGTGGLVVPDPSLLSSKQREIDDKLDTNTRM